MVSYDELGVRPVINAHNTLTVLGGSLMDPAVTEAMSLAARSFVDLNELQAAASARVARLTRNEDALVVSGASAGLLLGALAMMTRSDPRAVGQLLEQGAAALPRTEILMHRAHRIPYDNVLTLAGARVVEFGNAIQTQDWELDAAIGERTAGIVYVAGSHLSGAALPFEVVTRIARDRDVPVFVDAAAQLPPRENLWRFTQAGADLVAFSGGKELRGPQASGLLLGSRAYVDACRQHAFPLQRFGRPAKVGKEEIMGLLTALDLWLERDLESDLARAEHVAATWITELSDLPGITATRDWPGEAGGPWPRVRVQWAAGVHPPALEVAARLAGADPRVIVFVASECAFWINPVLVTDTEAELVGAAVGRELGRTAPAS
ncbi:aminotransferase class V-fold PLP-dependent enzyme [Occultella gossypii]|uniref:Aminotransferase class V-fold PLP-dependent enzyme n=1 Tax=Occultella gossypii TaxID=2800820 RepID=A0ABS7S3T0_9MICO|nr:aminotransferase class V-fold PLP-dependent enzyme [Occultella gossypii]MBZ2194975.1 aminotransferase class V-fold PLP-dependent enzyme [Occultella gossypii]